MKELNMSVFLNKADSDAAEAALVAARLKFAKIVTKMQTEGTHWTLSVAPEKKDV